MSLHPIISSMFRHKLTVMLVVMNIALTYGVTCNATYLIWQRIASVRQSTGIEENGLLVLYSEGGDSVDLAARRKTELADLQQIPGVQHAAIVDSLTFGDDARLRVSTSSNTNSSGGVSASLFGGTPDEVETLGLRLTAGRRFDPDEYVSQDDGIKGAGASIITKSLATRLFGDESPIGRRIYLEDGATVRVIGVVERLLRPGPISTNVAENQFSMLVPVTSNGPYATYLLRARPIEQPRVLADAGRILTASDPSRAITQATTFQKIKTDFFAHDREAINMLSWACFSLLSVTAVGIAGLSNFWVQQRRRTIGVRRTLGARRLDILNYFLVENFMLVSAGIVLGVGAALAINQILMSRFEIDRLPARYLPIAALMIWIVGVTAVLGPAWGAAKLEPALATKGD